MWGILKNYDEFVPQIRNATILSHFLQFISGVTYKLHASAYLREHVPTILSVCGALFPDHSYMVLTIELSLKLYGKIIQTRIWLHKRVFLGPRNFFFKKQVEIWKIENQKFY